MIDSNNGFFTVEESTKFSFFRIPKDLFISPAYQDMSMYAKLLYGMVIDRMELSRKNNWIDEDGRVYIIYSISEICESLECGKDKAIKMMQELSEYNLIDKRRRPNAATILYPKKVVAVAAHRNSEKPTSGTLKNRLPELGKTDFRNSGKSTSGTLESRLPELGKTDPSNTYLNETYENKRQTDTTAPACEDASGGYEPIWVREQLWEQLGCAALEERYGAALVDEIIGLLTDAICSTEPKQCICRQLIDREAIRSRFMKLEQEHVEKVIDTMRANAENIRNINAYMLSALYRAPTETVVYWDWRAHRDMRKDPSLGGRRSGAGM